MKSYLPTSEINHCRFLFIIKNVVIIIWLQICYIDDCLGKQKWQTKCSKMNSIANLFRLQGNSFPYDDMCGEPIPFTFAIIECDLVIISLIILKYWEQTCHKKEWIFATSVYFLLTETLNVASVLLAVSSNQFSL